MPGIRLSHTEQSLITDWTKDQAYRHPRLKTLHIEGTGGLRGIRDLTLDLDRPITVISGPSASGKSTLLELCQLAFRSIGSSTPDDIRPQFEMYFQTAPAEPRFDDFTVTWTYRGGGLADTTLEGNTLTLSADRPERPVAYLSSTRLLSVRRHAQAATYFHANPPFDETRPLTDEGVGRLRDVLNRHYLQASWNRSTNYQLQICETTAKYTSFNMSLAEESLIHMFSLLYAAPRETLIIIEDVEAGLHPAATERLARHIIEMAEKKSLQVILSTSSLDLIDSMPRSFRTLIQPAGTQHQVYNNPPMRRIVGALGSSNLPPDIVIFCEDTTAEALIMQSIDGELRRRSKIVRVGSKTNLALYAYSHHKSSWGHKVMCIWDGEVPIIEINGWIRSLNMSAEEDAAINRIKLPGSLVPERWIVEQLSQGDGVTLLAEELNESEAQAQLYLNVLATISEHHSIIHELAVRATLPEQQILLAMAKAVRRLSTHPLDALGDQIRRVSAGQSVVELS